jgi:outer membrane receptor protein involved in Fe transport
MMIKKRNIGLLFFILTLLVVEKTSAQQSISGIVADSVTNETLPFATVRLLDQHRQFVKSTITDSLGHFHFERISSGTYLFHFTTTGYTAKYSAAFVLTNTAQVLPRYFLSRSTKTLAAVTIIAQRPLIIPKIDGFIYNAGQDVQSAGESAADLLRKIPGVQVDQNGAPQMRGSNRIKVFIDGRPSVTYANSIAEALSHISADNIKTVEVITHPSARYDAEGVDGVLNIQTKRPVNDGLTGTLEGTLANRFKELTGSLTWKQRKVVVAVDLGPGNSDNHTYSRLARNDQLAGTFDLLQNRETISTTKSIYGGVNFIYLPDTLNTLNAGYRYSGNRFGTEITLDNLAGTDAFSRTIDNPANRYLHGINAGWLHRSADKSTEINLMGYWFYQGQSGHYLLDQYRNGQRDYAEKNRNQLDNREFSFQGDISKKLKNGNELELGAKGAFRKFAYENSFDVLDPGQMMFLPDIPRSDRFWFNWAIVAAYGSYTLNLPSSWKVKVGLRYEQTHWPLHFRDTALVIPDYRSLLPNLTVSKKITEGQNISAGYSRKLLRPYINYLNPVVNYIDSLNLEYGNPNLKPAITNSYDLSYTFQRSPWLLNVALFYNQMLNNIERVRIAQSGGVVANTYANISDYGIWGGSLNLSLRLKRFTFSMSNTTRYLDFGNQNGYLSRNGFVVNQSLDINYKPGTSWSIRTYANLNSRNMNIQGYTTGVQSYTFSVNKAFLDDALNLSGRCDNLFAAYRDVSEITDGATFNQRMDNRFINRFFRLSIRWKWGKKTVARPQVREIGGY